MNIFSLYVDILKNCFKYRITDKLLSKYFKEAQCSSNIFINLHTKTLYLRLIRDLLQIKCYN